MICLASFVTAILTFFSGFGLGTILLPLFALFFPVEVAIALTGVVHLANNLFKTALTARYADRQVLMRFGIPAVLASFAGAWLLIKLAGFPELFTYYLAGREFTVTPMKLIVAVLLLFFSLFEIIPSSGKMRPGIEKLAVGGLLSGFFGGLTGMQGAIRSAFLIKSGLDKNSYIATGVVIACMVDITRLSVYATRFRAAGLHENLPLVVAATLSAMAGALIGSRVLRKVTFRLIQVIVAVMLIIISLALGAGMI